MAAVRLVHRLRIVHRVLRQKCKIPKWISTFQKPLDLEVRHQISLRTFLLTFKNSSKILETLWLIIFIWLPHHSGNALQIVVFFGAENKNDVLYGHECVTKLCLSHLIGDPSIVMLRVPDLVIWNGIDNKITSSSFEKILGVLDGILHLIFILLEVLIVVWLVLVDLLHNQSKLLLLLVHHYILRRVLNSALLHWLIW